MVVEKGFRTWGFNLPNLNGTSILIFMQRSSFLSIKWNTFGDGGRLSR
jgi:hypothetical protein